MAAYSVVLIAITGNFASGKSSLSSFFREEGFEVINADSIVDDLYLSKKISETLKSEFGTADKKEIAKTIFDSSEKLEKLNSIIHPIVKKKLSEIHHSNKIVFAEVPLLFESKVEKLFDRIILVVCESKKAESRASRIGFKEADFRKRRSFQDHPLKNLKDADFIVDNSGSLKELKGYAKLISNELTNTIKEN